MRPLIQEISNCAPDALAASIPPSTGLVYLRTSLFDTPQSRYSFIAAQPFLTFRSSGSRCELHYNGQTHVQFGNPWSVLDTLMARFELLDEIDLPFPIGGCFGFWGYDLKNFVEPKLSSRAVNDLDLPDCHVGFYDSLVAFDHHMNKAWIISTGMGIEGNCHKGRAHRRLSYWLKHAGRAMDDPAGPSAPKPARSQTTVHPAPDQVVTSSFTRAGFENAVAQAQRYIRAGDIYQVNLSQRFSAPNPIPPWGFFQRLLALSPAPFSAFLDCGDFQIISSSPELFLRMSGPHILTRPIKGTRPRSSDPTRDAQLTYELQTSAKEMAELVMITDLLRNDLGKVSEFGSVHVPELVRLERYPHVQHLVSTVEGRLRPGTTHFNAFASCFPGGSITGAPKIRAMEIIDELEPFVRGPYTGALGFLGFNRETELSILIRAAVLRAGHIYFHTGAGIVADSIPSAEFDETMAKARGLFAALNISTESPIHCGIK